MKAPQMPADAQDALSAPGAAGGSGNRASEARRPGKWHPGGEWSPERERAAFYADLNRGRRSWYGELCIRRGVILPEKGDALEERWRREGWPEGRPYTELETWDG